ncbi:MAG: trigger factor [Propionibacteriaceae bacterium]|nr:trigger factor [Propionibacteriaceae bacterium]
MPSTLERLSPTRVKLTLEVPAAAFKPALDKAYRTVAGQISIPGFRKGKVPPAIIDQRVGRAAVLNEAVNAVLPDAYGEAVIEHSLAPLGRPDIDVVSLEPGQDAVFTAEVDVRPDFDLPEPASIAVEVEPVNVDDALVDERVALLRERFAETAETDRAAAAGDQVTIDLVAVQDGVELPDAAASGLSYVIGSGGFIDGLDEAVTGLKAGESATFSSTLVGGGRAGEAADVTVDVTAVAERSFPEVDDAFAQLVSQFDTVEEMRADLRQAAERAARYDQAESARNKVMEALVAAVPFELPEGFVEREAAARTEQVNQSLKRAGLSLEDYLAQLGQDKSADEFWAELAAGEEKAVRTRVLLDKLAEGAAVSVTQSDLTQLLFRKAQENGTSPQEELKHMEDHDHLGEWMSEIRRAKAMNAFVLQATVVDTSGDRVDLSEILADPAEAEAAAAESEAGEAVQFIDIEGAGSESAD